MVYHVHNIKFCKVLTIAYCDMQLKDGATQPLFYGNLNSVMAEGKVPKVNLKYFTVDVAQAYWNVGRKV